MSAMMPVNRDFLNALRSGNSSHIRIVIGRGQVNANSVLTLEEGITMTPMFVCAQMGHVDALKTLAALGASVSTPANDGSTPVFLAAHMGHVDAIKALAALGASVNTPANDGATPA